MRDIPHFTRKLMGTFGILFRLGMARTFGQYQHSGWNGDFAYARYRWRGREWIIPTSAAETWEGMLGMPATPPSPSQPGACEPL
ncbi:MAG: hypothetical protein WC807_14590 [Hyphomicrobium sp.]|jgi:hypothetical protein